MTNRSVCSYETHTPSPSYGGRGWLHNYNQCHNCSPKSNNGMLNIEKFLGDTHFLSFVLFYFFQLLSIPSYIEWRQCHTTSSIFEMLKHENETHKRRFDSSSIKIQYGHTFFFSLFFLFRLPPRILLNLERVWVIVCMCFRPSATPFSIQIFLIRQNEQRDCEAGQVTSGEKVIQSAFGIVIMLKYGWFLMACNGNRAYTSFDAFVWR